MWQVPRKKLMAGTRRRRSSDAPDQSFFKVTVESTYGKLRSVGFLEILAEHLKPWTELVVQHCDL